MSVSASAHAVRMRLTFVHVLPCSDRFPVVHARRGLSYGSRLLDAHLPGADAAHGQGSAEHRTPEGLARGRAHGRAVSVGDARCVGVGFEEKRGCCAPRELLQEAPDDGEDGTCEAG